MGKRKKFDRKLFEENDRKARGIAKKFLEDAGYKAIDNPKKYGPDLIVTKNDEVRGFVECEIKRVWKGKDFPYESVQFPERKGKYVFKNDEPVTFLMLNEDCSRMLLVDGNDVVDSPLVEVSNRFIRAGEYFYQVPCSKVKFFDVFHDRKLH